MPLTLRYVARSDVGLVREGNEDSGYAGPRVLVVADGMGGHAAGEVASAATVEEIVRLEGSLPAAGPRDPAQPDQAEDGLAQEAAPAAKAAHAAQAAQDALAAAVHGANDRIRSLVEEDPRREGMGTTVTAALWTGEQLVLAHVGDSRAYLLRDGELSQVTHDHTFVQSLVDEGRITEDEAGVHPARSLLLRALTGSGEVEPDLVVVDVRAGDRVLLCSDGLSGVVRFATIGEVLAGSENLEEAADRLVELALKGGAPDNVTCVVADLVEQSDPPASAQSDPVLVGAAAGPTERRSDTGRLDRVAPAAASARERGERTITDDDPEALRYAPRPPRRFIWLRRLAVLAVVGAILYVGLRLVSSWVGEQYYVGDEAGDVAVFQGLSQEVGPVRLSELYEVADGLPVEALPSIYQEQVAESIAADDLGDARRIVTRLRREACAAHPPATPEPTVPPTPAVTPDPAGTPLPTVAPAPEPGVATAPQPTPVAPAPTPTPSPTPTPGFPGLDCEEVSR
ncbi:MAG TPA: PP2C family serine/threonine-protein phosphatase [Jiangellales bacterium]|nr:PP2C family serine/threonine-protein phosphatase [Jiangellales bacterium]